MLRIKNGFKHIWNTIKRWKIATMIGILLGIIIWYFSFTPALFIVGSQIGSSFIESDISWIDGILVGIVSVVFIVLALLSKYLFLLISMIGTIMAISEIFIYNEYLKEQENVSENNV